MFGKNAKQVTPDEDLVEAIEEDTKEAQRRYLVIGSSGYRGVDSVDWKSGSLPNIVDYDTAIIDVRSLDDETLKAVSHDFLVEIRKQLIRLLDSDGEIIVLTDFRRTDHRPDSYPERIDNYGWCPIDIGIADESGETIVVKDSRFEGYLSKLKDWPYYLFIPKNCLSRELTDYYGSTYNTKYKLPLRPLLTNRYDKVLSGTCRIEVRRKRIKSGGYSTCETYQTDPDKVSGEIVLLPLLSDFDPKQAVALVLEELMGSTVRAEAPDWTDSINVPGVEDISMDIVTRRKGISDLFSEIEELDAKRRELLDFKRLLFASGTDLEEVVDRSLTSLGGTVTPAKYGEEEYILEFEGQEYLLEVKGVSKSITLGHLRQLNDYLLKYEEDTGRECKGILFGNAWRNLPPNQRGTKDKPEFPDNVIKRATQWQICLVSSTSFFAAFSDHLGDTSRAKTILKCLTSADGVASFAVEGSQEKEI